MKAKPIVSVVIATYKRPTIVLRAIDSVLNQSYHDLEIIIVDDASSDDTEKVIKSIKDERVHYIKHGSNKGISAARNTGIKAARGEYIAFLDDDDAWRYDKLDYQMRMINMYDALLTGALVNGKELKLRGEGDITLDELREGSKLDPSSLIARTDVLRDLWFDEKLRQGEDWDAFIRIAQKYRVGYINKPLLLYDDGDHERATTAAKNLSIAGLEERMEVLKKHKEFFGDYWFRRHVADVLLSYIWIRKNKLAQISYTINRVGVVPVLATFKDKLFRAMNRFLQK